MSTPKRYRLEDAVEINEDDEVIAAAGVDPAAGGEKLEKLDSEARAGASQAGCGEEAHVRLPRAEEGREESRRARRRR